MLNSIMFKSELQEILVEKVHTLFKDKLTSEINPVMYQSLRNEISFTTLQDEVYEGIHFELRKYIVE